MTDIAATGRITLLVFRSWEGFNANTHHAHVDLDQRMVRAVVCLMGPARTST